MQTATLFQVFTLMLFGWGLLMSQGSNATVYYYNSTESPDALVPCTQMIHWTQTFSDKTFTVECHSRQNPHISVTMKTVGRDQAAYFNPLDYDKYSQVWDCLAQLENIACSRFVGWANYGHESEVCGGRESCHQCKWVGLQSNIAMDSEQCMAEDAAESIMVTTRANVNNSTSGKAAALWFCNIWKPTPCQ